MEDKLGEAQSVQTHVLKAMRVECSCRLKVQISQANKW